MLLTPTEMERLTIYVAAELARKHKAKGLPLNHPEAVAYIVDEILEGAREGRSVADLIAWGSTLLTTDDVMPGVAHLMPMIQVEGTFPDGTKLVTIHDPIRPGKRKRAADEVVPGRDRHRRRRHRAQCRPAQGHAESGQYRRPAGADRQPLSFLRDQQGARFRSGQELRHASRHSRRHRRALRPRGVEGGRAHRVRRHRRAARTERPHRGQLAERSHPRRSACARARERGFKGA